MIASCKVQEDKRGLASLKKMHVISCFSSEHGPITYKNDSDKAEFVTAIDSLRVYGGRDCPELSFTGMLEAYRANPQLGSPMFVFTDASAKDDTAENMVKLKATASQYGSSINFFTNHIGCGGSKGALDLSFLHH